MISQNPDISCTNARIYYFDFLNEETREGIPDGALQHIKQCGNCQAEVDSLEALLSQADENFESEQRRRDSAVSSLLRLHFEYIGEPVNCDTVKPFLASLADSVLQIRVPTPITTHLDKCRSCRDDLKILLDMHLPHKYLCRLGQLLAEKPADDYFLCVQAQAAIPAVVSMDFHETDAEILKHLCTCSDCRKQLYLHRESVRKELLINEGFQNGFPCDSVSAADIYDYCLPYGIDPNSDEYSKFRGSLTSHLRSCPKCLARMQHLHRTIFDIAERTDSGVITVYNIDESVKVESCCESKSYAGFPISSETADTQDNLPVEQPKTINLTAQPKHKVPALNMKPLLKAGLAAAAVIVIGLALLFNAPTAQAVTLEHICRAIDSVKNVYIATFEPGKTEPKQEIWVSRSLNLCLTKTGKELVLWDLSNKVKTKLSNADSVEKSQLSTNEMTIIKKMMTGLLGLVPFRDISLIPENAEWNNMTNNELMFSSDNAIYELRWTESSLAEKKETYKWRFFVDPKTYLPRKTESFTKKAGESEYTLNSIMEVEYLADSDIEHIVNEVSF